LPKKPDHSEKNLFAGEANLLRKHAFSRKNIQFGRVIEGRHLQNDATI
jgi:hypothetical protein